MRDVGPAVQGQRLANGLVLPAGVIHLIPVVGEHATPADRADRACPQQPEKLTEHRGLFRRRPTIARACLRMARGNGQQTAANSQQQRTDTSRQKRFPARFRPVAKPRDRHPSNTFAVDRIPEHQGDYLRRRGKGKSASSGASLASTVTLAASYKLDLKLSQAASLRSRFNSSAARKRTSL